MDGIGILLKFILAGNLTEWISTTVKTIAGIGITLGLLVGIAGVIMYIAVGVLEIQLFTGMFSTSGMRKVLHGMYTFIIIPAVIGVLYVLNSLAVNGMLYSNVNDPGSVGWMIHQIWSWIIDAIMRVFGVSTT